MDELRGRPFVFICSTTSADGKLASFERTEIDLATVDHKDFRTLGRACADAVMVGGRTFLAEDPSLTVGRPVHDRFRVEGKELRDPMKVAVVTRLSPLRQSNLLDKGTAPKLIFTTTQSPAEAIESVRGRAEVIVLGEQQVDLPRALEILREKFGVKQLMVEGGGTLNAALLRHGLVDEIRVKMGNLILGGQDAPSLVDGPGFGAAKAPAVKLMHIEKLDRYSCVLVYRVVSAQEAAKPTGIIAATTLRTRHGEFDVLAFHDDHELKDNAVLRKGSVRGKRRVPVRVQSECLTGDTFGSYHCDCREQLEMSLQMVAELGGLLIYLRQEGRGNGLINKIRIYELMDQGHDTVEATRQLDIPVDRRSYEFVADVLNALEVRSISLITNNPRKKGFLTRLGIEVEDTLPVIAPANDINRDYLESKRSRLQHELPGSGPDAQWK